MWDDELANVLTPTPHRAGHQWFRTPLVMALKAGRPEVDEKGGILRSYAVATKGPALGHNMLLDDEFLDSLVVAGNLKEVGIKSRFDHPNASSTSMGSFLGRSRNFRRDRDVVRADLHLSEAAKHSPQGNLYDYTLKMAQDEPEMFGASIVFSGASVYQKDTDGNELTDEPRLARLERFLATDVVDDPAANPSGIFSAEDTLARKLSEFLDHYYDTERFAARLDACLKRRGFVAIPSLHLPQEDAMNETAQVQDAETIRQTTLSEERRRVAEIHEAAQPGQEELAQSMVKDGTSADDARRRFLSDLRSKRQETLSRLQDAAPKSAGGGQATETVKTDFSDLPAHERYEKEWEASPEIRKEFGALSTYRAYRKNEDAGRVKLYKSRDDMPK